MGLGHFGNGEQIGEWIIYDKKRQVYRVTNLKRKPTKNV